MGALRFEAFTLDVPGGVLMRGGKPVPLRRQPLKVLAYLAERSGRLVTNKELIESCWENPKQTSANSLAQCVKAIREALGETDHEIIRTIHGQGYVFAAPVSVVPAVQPAVTPPPEQESAPPIPQTLEEPSVQPQAGVDDKVAPVPTPTRREHWGPLRLPRQKWQALAAAVAVAAVLLGSAWAIWTWAARPAELTMAAVPSIAVLPIRTANDEPDMGDIGPALADEITTELARIPRAFDLRIKSVPGYWQPVASPPRLGRALGVRYIVLGSTRREGHARLVNIQLIEAESGRPVGAESFTYTPGASGAQNRTAARIARMLAARVLRTESRLPLPAHPEAGHYVILGRALMSVEAGMRGTREAMAYFDKARALDPNSYGALLGYGRTRVNQVLNRWVPRDKWDQLLNEAGSAIEHAGRLDSRNAGLHVLRGAYLRAKGKDDEAIAEFEHAISLHPNYSLPHAELGRAKIEVGLASETVAHVEDAIGLNPTDTYRVAWYYWAGMAEAHLGRNEEAIRWLLKTRSENRAYPNTVPWLAVAHAGLGQWDQARTYMKEHLANFPKFSLSSWRLALPHRHQGVVAQRLRIEALLRQLGAPETPPDDKMQTGLVNR